MPKAVEPASSGKVVEGTAPAPKDFSGQIKTAFSLGRVDAFQIEGTFGDANDADFFSFAVDTAGEYLVQAWRLEPDDRTAKGVLIVVYEGDKPPSAHNRSANPSQVTLPLAPGKTYQFKAQAIDGYNGRYRVAIARK